MALGQKAGDEEFIYWESTEKKMETKLSELMAKVTKAKEAWVREEEIAQ